MSRRLLLLAGALALAAATLVGDRPLSAHMAQHLLVTMVAAPLLAAGAPVRLVLKAASPRGRRALGRALRSRVVRALGHPAVGWWLFVGVTLGTHLTGFYDAAERHAALHAVEHALYLATAMLFWMPLIGADPLPHRLGWLGRTLALLFAMPAMSAVGLVLIDSDRVRYASYAGPGAVRDQHLAGTLMWVGGSLAGAVLVLAVGWLALAGEERRQRAREAYARAEAPT